MTGSAFTEVAQGASTDELWKAIAQFVYAATGSTSWQRLWNLTGVTDNASYVVTIQNQGTGGHLNVPGILQVQTSGVTASALTVTGALSAGATTLSSLHVTGVSTLDGTVGVGGALNVTGITTMAADLLFTASNAHDIGASGTGRPRDIWLGRDLVVGRNAGVVGSLGSDSLGVVGNVALGSVNANTLTVIATSTFKSAAGVVQAFLDPANNRVIVGSATALGSDTTPNLQVVGRLYVAPDVANDLALQVRRSSAATVGFSLGVTSTNDFVFKDDGGVETFRVGDVASTYQAIVTGAFRTTGSITVAAGGIGVTGSSVFNSGLSILGGLTVTTGGITVSAGGIGVTGSSTFSTTVSLTTGNLVAQTGALIANNSSLSGTEVIRATGTVRLDGSGAALNFAGTSQIQATVGAAGGASALPATPSGYLKITASGVSLVVPYYLP